MAPFLTNDISATGGDRTGETHATNGMESSAQHSPAPVEDHAVDTEFLIVGAGPAGAALACFLGSHGVFRSIRVFLRD